MDKKLITPGMRDFALKVDDERQNQLKQWGQQPLPDGTGDEDQIESLAYVREWMARAEDTGEVTHAHVLVEEVYEVFAETDPDQLKAELIQVAAVCAKWIADIDSRT